MGKKKRKQNASSERQSQASSQQRPKSQQRAPTQQQPQSQRQAPTQQQPQSQQQTSTQKRSQSQQQAPTEQQVRSQPQQQSPQKKPHPKTEDQSKKVEAKASSSRQDKPTARTPESFVWGQQTQPQSSQQSKKEEAKASSSRQDKPTARTPESFVWGQQTQPQSSQQSKKEEAKASSSRQDKPTAWTPESFVWGQQTQPQSSQSAHSTSQPATSAWGSGLQTTPFMQSVDQSARGRTRLKTELPPKNVGTQASSSHQQQSQAWVPEYAFPPSATSDNQPTAKPQSQPAQPRPQQQSHHSLGGSTASTLDKNIGKLSISNVSRFSSASQSAAIATYALIPLSPHKGCGTRGQKVIFDVNFLPLLVDNLLPTVYQYDVSIEPNLPKRMLPQIFETYCKTNFKNICVAFDGQKIAVSPQVLPDCVQRETKVIDENNRECVYMVEMKEARDSKIDFKSLKNYTTMRQYDAPLRAMQMLEIVLKSPFLYKSGVQAGRSFYMRLPKRHDLGDNYELWTGLYQATVLGSRPYLNVDIAHKAFPTEMSVVDLLHQIDRRALQTHLQGLMIRYKMPGNPASARTYKFFGLNPNSKSFKFKNDKDQKEYTIEEYFRSRKVTIKHPEYPTLKLGNSVRNITVPMEFCSVAGNQAVNKKCTENQTKNMIKAAATSTDDRKRKIIDMLKRISHNESPTLNQFGIQVGTDFTTVQGRILPAPTLEYKDRNIKPSKGVWRVDNSMFWRPVTVTKYAVLIVDKHYDDNNVRQFCEKIKTTGDSLGMSIDRQYQIYRLDPSSTTIREDLRREMSQMIEKEIALLFCVIPDRGDIYSKVKQCAEIECGILTQCIKQVTITRKGSDPSTVSNILLKVNAKLNGTNHKLVKDSIPPLMAKPFMLVGADVTHPSPGQENIPSVVGVVSSHDKYGFQYNKCWRLQDPKQEMISDFDQILMEHLQYFEGRWKRLPEAILYFRDGVSEGQFQQVLNVELNAMYRGCQQYRDRYKPKITFIVVQKRHHTRFFPQLSSNLGRDDRKNNNVPAGTIVDNGITHPNENQFYLVSHQSIQGVARPTKYCLLRDDSDIPIDDLQAITYNLCHFFARCTRSVSYPAPTYYAHLAAARGRVYIEGKNINMDRLDREFKSCTVKPQICKNHPMYFI